MNYLSHAEFTRKRNGWTSGSTIIERLANLVRPLENGCLEWTGAYSSNGRPFLKVGTRNLLVSRLIWIWNKGRIPKGLIVRHVVCANKRCANIDHLALGTHFDNAQDRDNDGNTAKGEAHYKALLTEDQVREIILHKESHTIAAAKYKVGRSTIINIRCGNTWKHIPRP